MDEFLRSMAKKAFINVMMQEVEQLCGPAWRPKSDCRRSGSAKGRYFFQMQEEEVKRPRVRKDGKEVVLKSYQAGSSGQEVQAAMLRALAAGVPSRQQKQVFAGTSGTSRSNVSRLWQEEGAKYVEQLRCRDLGAKDYLVLMLDGVRLCENLWAVVALGIGTDGHKQILDFQIGSSENFEVCRDLLCRIKERGFGLKRRPLAITDGSQALRKALKFHWPDLLLQRCLVHKERNLKSYLARKHHSELAHLFTRLRRAEGLEAATEVWDDLHMFVSKRNKVALASLEEAGKTELLAVHSLGAPSTLNVTLLNTNCIENTFRNMRLKTNRVTKWNVKSDMAMKWVAYGLLDAESGFRRIRHYHDLEILAKILEDRDTGGNIMKNVV